MKFTKPAIALTLFVCGYLSTFAQKYHAVIEPAKLVKADPRLIVQSGYLVVPENRSKPNGRKIRIPFLFARRPDQDARKNIALYTTGGPGYSTTLGVDSIRYDNGFFGLGGGYIMFDQRGTKRAQPALDCHEVDSAIARSYRTGLNQDSLVQLAVKKCREKFVKQGIDLSAYNTVESAEDINDLRLALNIESLNLVGISYSGGLMLTMARNHPEGVHTLILNSPLPGFVNYEETALFNINEALEQVFAYTAADTIAAKTYPDLSATFRKYFTNISGKKFKISYLEKGTKDSINITYTKNELLDVIVGRLTTRQVKELPAVIMELVNGNHKKYIPEVLDDIFNGNGPASLGMRYSIYCSEQIAYANLALQKQQEAILPWLSGYLFNNVDKAICDCWKVTPAPENVKTPVYSNIPALIVAGDIDPWTRPFYNRLIKRTMPNSQLLIKKNAGHGPGYIFEGVDYLKLFLADPLKRLISTSGDLIIE